MEIDAIVKNAPWQSNVYEFGQTANFQAATRGVRFA